ncbi:MAG TPA: SRPBCC domain-containing protein [Streptosporangiaceae bacterium]|nr:SRPBCC domain-containing protein [Streptosporangiaceae bacterium]
MAGSAEPHGTRAVTALRRPPVRQATIVRAGIGHTFGTFVSTIGAWWPAQPFSAGKDRVRDVTIEQRSGGRVYETWNDGTEIDWGTVTAWEPPARFVMTWTGTPAPTEVEFSFASLGPALTRVAVEHRGWEALTDEQLSQDCALPGGYTAGAYLAGWAQILEAFCHAIGEESE